MRGMGFRVQRISITALGHSNLTHCEAVQRHDVHHHLGLVWGHVLYHLGFDLDW